MLFSNELIVMIIIGRKTVTRRDKGYYKVSLGRIFTISSNKGYGKFKVTKFYQQALGSMTNLDAQKEGFIDLNDFINYVNKKGKKLGFSWNPKLVVDVIEFEYLGLSS